jgi:hypothetical protein
MELAMIAAGRSPVSEPVPVGAAEPAEAGTPSAA